MVLQQKLLGPRDREAVQSVWTFLDALGSAGSLTTSWNWTATWLEHFGDEVPHHFVIAEQDGEPAGVALLTRSGDRLRGRNLHVGTAGEPVEATVFVEHNALHCRPGTEQAFANAVFSAAAELGGWDRLVIDGFRPADAEAITRTAEGRWHAAPQGCPITDLVAVRMADNDLCALLPSSRRSRTRRNLRAFGDVEQDWCGEPAAALAALDELAALNRNRWQAIGERTPFADQRFVDFHRSLIGRLAPTGDAWVFQARDAEGTIGSLYCLRDGKRVLFYQSGMRESTDNRRRPGLAAHTLCINACAERGFEIYDFLAPPVRYKEELATGQDELVWAHHSRSSVLAPVRRAAKALRRARRNQLPSS